MSQIYASSPEQPPADLTPAEQAESLARMYEADQGNAEDAPSQEQRTELAGRGIRGTLPEGAGSLTSRPRT